jgi:hypothetical protein
LCSKTLRDWFFMLRMETGGNMFTLIRFEHMSAVFGWQTLSTCNGGKKLGNLAQQI